jgi:hypothetical protein
MARYDWNQERVMVFEQGRPVGAIRRVVFSGGLAFRETHPDAAGFVNYQGAIAALHRSPDGAIFLERREPLIRGYRPLVGIWN